MTKDLVVVAVAVADIAAMAFDIIKTEQGLKKGVASEGNEAVTLLFGQKPGPVGLYIWNSGWIALFAALGLYPFHTIGMQATVASIVALTVDAVKHYLGGRLWSALLAGKKLKQDRTALEKFLGLGIGD